jgi:hypothetical protein
MSVELFVGLAIVALLVGLLVGFQLGTREGMCEVLKLMSRPQSLLDCKGYQPLSGGERRSPPKSD